MFAVLVAAALVQFSIHSDAPPRTPSPSLLARALTKFGAKETRAADVRNIECEGFYYFPGSPMSYVCKWGQRSGETWHNYTSYFEFKDGQWTLTRKPGTDQPIDPSSASE